MNKKMIFTILLVVDVILAVVLIINLAGVSEELSRTYYGKDASTASSLLMYLDRENYGTVAVLARSYRVGAEVDEADEDLYRLGEYGELSFLERINAGSGEDELVRDYEKRRAEIRDAIPGYKAVLDKMDLSIDKAIME